MRRLLLLLPFLLAACASAKIDVAVDIYKNKPAADVEEDAARSEDQLTAAVELLASTRERALRIAHGYEATLGEVERVVLNFLVLHAAVNQNSRFDPRVTTADLASQRSVFAAAIDGYAKQVNTAYGNAQQALAKYIEVSFDPTLVSSKRTIARIDTRAAYRAAEENFRTTLDSFKDIAKGSRYARDLDFFANEGARTFASSGKALSLTPDYRDAAGKLASSFKKLASSIDELEADGIEVADFPLAQLRRVAEQLDAGDASGLRNAMPRLVWSLQAVADQGALGFAARGPLAELARNQTFYESQIDRLQDPADPAWREVIDPENAPNWVPYFSKTSFYAEGKAEVVVIRDRPGHFRLQRGINNPAALIQGQLEVSRSIASAATAVLGAFTGVKVPLLGDGADTGAAAAVQAESGSLAGQKAAIDAEEQLRAGARRSVELQLELLRTALLRLNAPEGVDKPQRDALYQQATTALAGYNELLKFTGGDAQEGQ